MLRLIPQLSIKTARFRWNLFARSWAHQFHSQWCSLLTHTYLQILKSIFQQPTLVRDPAQKTAHGKIVPFPCTWKKQQYSDRRKPLRATMDGPGFSTTLHLRRATKQFDSDLMKLSHPSHAGSLKAQRKHYHLWILLLPSKKTTQLKSTR